MPPSDLESKVKLPAVVNRVNVRAQTKHKNPKPVSPDIKSAWCATALLTLESVYHAVTTPACEAYAIEDESTINKLARNTSGTCVCASERGCVCVVNYHS